jgi:hypothetical protein
MVVTIESFNVSHHEQGIPRYSTTARARTKSKEFHHLNNIRSTDFSVSKNEGL